MAYGGKNKRTPPRVCTRFSLSMENEQADAGQDGQTCLARPNSQARTGIGIFFLVHLTTNRIGNLTRLMYTLLYVMTIHTHKRKIYCNVYPQLPPVIGAPRGCCGLASGIYFPRPLWFGGCAPHATPCSVPSYP